MAQYVIDLQGKRCPDTQLTAVEEIGRVGKGEVFDIIVDNPTSLEGVMVMLKKAQHEVVDVKNEESVFTITVRKNG